VRTGCTTVRLVVELRGALPDDAGFLAEMLTVAADWRHESPGPVADVLAEPVFAHYVEGWPRPGDLGVVAVEDGQLVGAAWCRQFSDDDRGFGFVDASTPELSIGVRASARGRGIGRRLIEHLLEEGRATGVVRVSLSVEPDNPARRLYERLGFKPTGPVDGAITMVRRLTGSD
jgi:ribosomal protein S18 acetylase RimI-like enzyme